MSDEIKYPQGFGLKDVVAWGTTGLVVIHEPSQTVIKTPLWEDCSDHMLREQEIYERFTRCGGHQGILRYYGTFESGIRLEYALNGDLRSFNKQHKVDIDFGRRLQWATQVAEALDFVHRAGVIHGDLTCQNIFLDKNLNAKLADFAGSSLDGSELLIAVTASHEYPGPVLSALGDLFAFGSTLYEIMTGNAPYAGLPEDEIYIRYSKGEFLDTVFLGAIGDIIRNCWQGQYRGAGLIVKDLKAQGQILIPPLPLNIKTSVLVVFTIVVASFIEFVISGETPWALSRPFGCPCHHHFAIFPFCWLGVHTSVACSFGLLALVILSPHDHMLWVCLATLELCFRFEIVTHRFRRGVRFVDLIYWWCFTKCGRKISV